MSDPLDPRALLALLPHLLPPSSSSPLPRPADSIAALVHAIHVALGFRREPSETVPGADPPGPSNDTATTPTLTPTAGPGGDAMDTDTDVGDDAASETTTAVDPADDPNPAAHVDVAQGRLPQGWNARGEDAYVFAYAHPQSSMRFRVRVGRMGARVQIDGMADDGAPHTISVLVADVLDTARFPVPSAATATAGDRAQTDPARAVGFQSVDSVRNLVDAYNRDVIARLIPGLNKEGYRAPKKLNGERRSLFQVRLVAPPPGGGAREPPNAGPAGGQPPNPARPNPLIDPLHPAAPPAGLGGVPVASIGHRDLDPFGGRNPLDPLGRPVPGSAGGGMLADFNHPLFDARRNRDGRDPAAGPGGAINPPGARWDPVGPDTSGSLGPRFPSAGGNPLGGVGITDPEWTRDRFGDDMPPPGEDGPQLGFNVRPGLNLRGRGGRPGAGGLDGGLPGGGRFGGGGGGFGGGGGGFGGAGGFGGGII